MQDPLQQFAVKTLIPINVFGYDISFTNSALFMCIAVFISIVIMFCATRNMQIIPHRAQQLGEAIYDMVSSLIDDNIGEKGRKFIPLVFSVFMFVMLCNLLGMMPYGFTSTSQISITLALAIIIFFAIIIIGFINHGIRFLSIFLPSGVPIWLAPLMILIELFTFLARPFTLSVRLSGNMVAGHVLLKVLASFVVAMGIYWGWIPISFMALISGFEIFIAMLQAYIFTILTCVYLDSAVNLH